MGYGFSFLSKTKLTNLAKQYAPNNPDTEYQLSLALEAYAQHKIAEEAFLEFLYQNNEHPLQTS
jgi:hypothetical protein